MRSEAGSWSLHTWKQGRRRGGLVALLGPELEACGLEQGIPPLCLGAREAGPPLTLHLSAGREA